VIVSGTILPFLNLPLRVKIAFEKGEAEEGIDAAQNYNKQFASASRGRILLEYPQFFMEEAFTTKGTKRSTKKMAPTTSFPSTSRPSCSSC
jgi:hypothetical protein